METYLMTAPKTFWLNYELKKIANCRKSASRKQDREDLCKIVQFYFRKSYHQARLTFRTFKILVLVYEMY